MRPPSYYTSLANSSSTNSYNNRSNSSQQLRSSFSSSSSTSYATRTHLPFVPQTMLVAHCYTGVGSSTKPYGQSTGAFYSSSSRLSGSYTSSIRPLSTKRHHLPSASSYSSASPSSSYTPRSSYLTSSGLSCTPTTTTSTYRRPSAYTYEPIKLRERPVLNRISNQINQRYSDTTSAAERRPPSGLAEGTRSSSSSSSSIRREKEKSDKELKEEQAWSSDVARNISRNKYLIKFREFDKARNSIVPDKTDELVSSELIFKQKQEEFETREGPNISVIVKLPTDEEETSMRVPPVGKGANQLASSLSTALVDAESQLHSDQKSEACAGDKDECDTIKSISAPVAAGKDGESKEKIRVPKEKRNIKLKIKNVNPVGQDHAPAATVDQQTAIVEVNKKKTNAESTKDTSDETTAAAAPPPPKAPAKTKVKRLAKNKIVDSVEPTVGGKKQAEPKSELKAKDSLLTKRLSDRKVLSPKQFNLGNSESPAAAESNQVGPLAQDKTPASGELSSPQSDSAANLNKRIRFREYNYEDFNFLSVLGHGGWGFVILAELKNHNACFAVKCIKKITIVEDDDFDSIMIERKVLTLGNIHPFICKLFCTFETQGYLFFAMEYCAGGDLMFHVQREGKFTEARSRFYAAEIICAIKFLHNQHIIYRDLKLDNILLDSSGHIRLVDFGMCQCRTYREEMLPSNFCGTPEYISPEIIKGVPYNHSVDWWSFGVLLYEMAVGKMPFRGNDENELLWNVCYEQIHYPMFLTKELTSLLQSLLEREPTKRMGMSTCKAGDIYDQAWFKGVDWRAMEELRIPPPFVPDVTSERDVQNFDSDFTQSTPELSPVDESTLKKIDQSQFQKFPYTNPNISIFG